MAASVRIDDEAFVDPRVERLGVLAGYNRFEALGRLAHLWRVCTHRETYTVPESFVVACLGEKGPAALVEADLGEKVEGGIRVRGTEGRIEWLAARREASKAGGQANKQRIKAAGKPDGSRRKPKGSQTKPNEAKGEPDGLAKGEPKGSQANPSDSPPTPTPTPTPTPDLPSEEVPPSAGDAAIALPFVAPVSASPHHRCVAFFCDSWKSRHGDKYPFVGGRDAKAIKDILAACGDDEDKFRGAVQRYLADDDPFFADKNHPLNLFLSQLAKWLVPATGKGRAPPKGDRTTDYARSTLLDLVDKKETG